MSRLLDIRGLCIGFRAYGRHRRVLHHVNLHVDEGERVSLIGQSGSGKTVTMRAIIGTLPTPPAVIEQGSIHYAGQSLLGKALKLDVFSVIDKPVDMTILREQLNRLFIRKFHSDIFKELPG